MSLLEHGEHNKACCEYLINSDQFYDWSIVTAYYSAIKYIEHLLFPLEFEGKNYEKFADYFNAVCTPAAIARQQIAKKHLELIELYQAKGGAWTEFRWLYDSCMNIRYNSNSGGYKKYNKKAMANRAWEALATIEATNIKNPTSSIEADTPGALPEVN